MSDWIGLIFIVFLIFCAVVGLSLLSKPRRKRTAEEFEKSAAESNSLLSAGVNALNGMINPEAAKGKVAIEEIKKGSYDKRRLEGKAIGRLKKGEK